jgi:general secretion pathway protein I
MALPLARPAREAGFTILEVLTAFVLLAVSLAAILQVFSGGLRDAQLADEYARAVMMAQSRLAAYTAAEKLEEGTRTGRDEPFDWTVSAAAYDERKEDPGAQQQQGQVDYNLPVRLLRVESKVEWQAADGRRRDVRLATLVIGAKP